MHELHAGYSSSYIEDDQVIWCVNSFFAVFHVPGRLNTAPIDSTRRPNLVTLMTGHGPLQGLRWFVGYWDLGSGECVGSKAQARLKSVSFLDSVVAVTMLSVLLQDRGSAVCVIACVSYEYAFQPCSMPFSPVKDGCIFAGVIGVFCRLQSKATENLLGEG